MITVTQALTAILDLVSPTEVELVPLENAAGRVLAQTMTAQRAQPPFAASAMDGYAIADDDPAIGAQFTVIGEAAAGHRFTGSIGAGQAVRIFTGAPVPEGGKRVIIQEDVTRDGDQITLNLDPGSGAHIRPAGGDFEAGSELLAPVQLTSVHVALLASMNVPNVPVHRRPVIALIATGDELVMPGDVPEPDQIIASNTFGLKAMFEAAGAQVRLLPIAKDTASSLTAVLDLARGANMIVTIGGASVGDHDIVAQVAADSGLERSFYKVAMRPGKPLMAGSLGGAALIGLPGNPVSSMVCGVIFILPAIEKMLGMPAKVRSRRDATLTHALDANGPREHYMRAELSEDGTEVRVFDRQDSSLLSVLARANALVVRPPNDPECESGQSVQVIAL